jgi:uncharacterized membrane protein HdeD (DUF308 family)
MSSSMSSDAVRGDALVSESAPAWWIFLITGTLWLLFSIVVFRFNWTTVSAISVLFGVVALVAGASEFVAMLSASGWWKLIRGLVGVAFVVIGIVAFVHPGNTFAALAAVMSFYFIVKGLFDVTLAIAARDQLEVWWLTLTIGVAEVLIGFWAAGDFGHQTILLVVWVGATALTRGIGEILLALALRGAAK